MIIDHYWSTLIMIKLYKKPNELRKILEKYWENNGWNFPSKKWTLKLTLLLKDSMILFKDALEESKPFFLLPSITKEGQEFLNKKEIKDSLKYIFNYLNERNNRKKNKKIFIASRGIYCASVGLHTE